MGPGQFGGVLTRSMATDALPLGAIFSEEFNQPAA